MGKTRRFSSLADGLTIRDRVLGVLRPGVEALLLGAVALGVAQAGWTVVTPDVAGASGTASPEDPEPRRITVAELRSPFAAEAAGIDASHAVSALLAGIQVRGVRLSSEQGASGAVLTLGDGAQRAFAIGDEVGGGVTLADVGAGYVVLSYEGGQRQLTMSSTQGFSFARAMMGQAQAARAIPAVENVASPPVAGAPLQLTGLAPVMGDNGGLRGWRVGADAPEMIMSLGFAPGDVVVSINGDALRDVEQVRSAVAQGSAEFGVERGGASITLSTRSRSPA